jgi:hypothetical protein
VFRNGWDQAPDGLEVPEREVLENPHQADAGILLLANRETSQENRLSL